jgi:type IV pilus assembly protein PilA
LWRNGHASNATAGPLKRPPAGPTEQLVTARTSSHSGAQAGFSLVELLAVTLIVGVLTMIALPQFLGQQDKGRDASAKQDARSVVGAVESCFTTAEDYRECTDPGDLRDAAVRFGSGRGQVEVDTSSASEYAVTAHSLSGTDFILARVSANAHERTCTRSGRGGCDRDGAW